jgi:hypothetical protein
MAAYIQGNTVRVFSFENGGPAQDTAFMLSVFC